MIEYKKGNLLNATEKYIMHGCNAKGVMGAGVALAIKRKWPHAYISYKKWLSERWTSPVGSYVMVSCDDKIIINAITQYSYGKGNVPIAEKTALTTILTSLKTKNIETIAIPKICCGYGGLNWEKDIVPILNSFDINFKVYVL